MHFEVRHELSGSPTAVAAILCDPAFHEGLELPDVSAPEIIEHSTNGDSCVCKLRYEFTGHLDPIAQKVVAGRKLEWNQDLTLDCERGRGTLEFSASVDPKRLNGQATIALDALDALDGTRTRLTIAGDLHVRIPLLGGRAEKAIVPGIVRRLEVEADGIEAALERS
jgi:hypothetical protein